jgi:hypothetical protein
MAATTPEAPAPVRTLGLVLVLMAVAGYVAWLSWGMAALPYNSWAPIVAAPLIFFASLPLIHRIASTGSGPSFALMCVTLVLKLAAALIYVRVTDQVYGGVGDYTFYHENGARLAESYRAGNWGAHVDAVPGYGSVQFMTGAIYRFTGTSLQVGFLVFSWLAFWGLVMIAVAVRTAMPMVDMRRCSLLILLLPSTLYWSSALGKDSLMMFAIGICVLGVARFVAHRRGGLPLALCGFAAATVVRPHVALMLFAAFALTFLVRRSGSGGLGLVSKVLGAVVLVLVGAVLVRYATAFLKIEDLSPTAVNHALDNASASSAGGEASINPPVGGALARVPWAVVTVLFRPFPWEAHNVQALVSSFECLFLAVLTWRSRDRLRALPGLVRRSPYLLFVLLYSAMFVFAFSSFANLGTLARERVQLLPLLVVVLCVPARPAPGPRDWTRHLAGPPRTVPEPRLRVPR